MGTTLQDRIARSVAWQKGLAALKGTFNCPVCRKVGVESNSVQVNVTGEPQRICWGCAWEIRTAVAIEMAEGRQVPPKASEI